jgi:hypothetical protein
LMGVVVLLSPVCWAINGAATVNWKNTSDATILRANAASDRYLFKDIHVSLSLRFVTNEI